MTHTELTDTRKINDPTEKLVAIIKDKGVNIKRISEATGIPYSSLQPSLKGNRPLRVSEFFAVCSFLKIDSDFFRSEKGA